MFDDPAARKRALLLEFEQTIAPQKLEISQSLPLLWKQCYEPVNTVAHIAVPMISPGSAFGMPSAKRSKVSSAKDPGSRKMEEIWKICINTVSKLSKRKEAPMFRDPVDPVKHGVPNYFSYIKEPMDLGTIKLKLQKRVYTAPEEFAYDVRLVWTNCMTYNQPMTDVYKKGQSLSQAFEKMWEESQVEELWREVQMEQDPMFVAGMAMESQLVTLGNQLQSLVTAAPSQATAGPGGEMAYMEKRKLSLQLAQLQPAKLQMVMDILLDEHPSRPDGEAELEIDNLSSSTLWRLHALTLGAAAEKHMARPNVAEKTPHVAPTSANGHIPAESAGQQTESDSEHGSPRDVKGSTMDEPHGQSVFVKDRQVVDESATNPREQPTFVKDRADRKTDVSINTANWSTLAEEGGAEAGAGAHADGEAGGAVEGEGDEMWKSFQSIAEQKAQREEEQKRREEEQRSEQERVVRERKEAAQKLQREEEARQRKLREEEERQLQQQEAARKEQLQKELAELTAKENTANLTQQADMNSMLAQMQGPSTANDLASVGLSYKNDIDEGFDFDDE